MVPLASVGISESCVLSSVSVRDAKSREDTSADDRFVVVLPEKFICLSGTLESVDDATRMMPSSVHR